MKLFNLNKIIVTGIALAGLTFISSVRANVEVLFVGGNASQNVLYDRVTNILTGGITSVTVSTTNSTVRQYVGTITAQPGLGTVTIDFSLLGAIQGLQDLAAQHNENTALGVATPPTVAVSSTSPGQVGISATPFTATKTLVVPYVFVISTNKSPAFAGFTNLTQRQAYYLETAGSNLPSAFFGGTNTTDAVYFVGRSSDSAVRAEIDANIHNYSGIVSYRTNASGIPVLDTSADPGLASGGAVANNVKIITNAVGTVAAQDISTLTPLTFEGVPFSITNVETGSYPLWFYEQWFYFKTGQLAPPSTAQLTVITNLLSAVTNATFQNTGTVFTNRYARLSNLQVSRPSDGGPISSLLY